MKNFKRIAALAGVVILLLVFCLPMVFAWGSSTGTDRGLCFLDGVPDLGT